MKRWVVQDEKQEHIVSASRFEIVDEEYVIFTSEEAANGGTVAIFPWRRLISVVEMS